jgi:hypothetical protein
VNGRTTVCLKVLQREVWCWQVCGGGITDVGVQHIAQIQGLKSLSLAQNPRITDASLPFLAQIRGLEVIPFKRSIAPLFVFLPFMLRDMFTFLGSRVQPLAHFCAVEIDSVFGIPLGLPCLGLSSLILYNASEGCSFKDAHCRVYRSCGELLSLRRLVYGIRRR